MPRKKSKVSFKEDVKQAQDEPDIDFENSAEEIVAPPPPPKPEPKPIVFKPAKGPSELAKAAKLQMLKEMEEQMAKLKQETQEDDEAVEAELVE